jgi:hypothetical protein
VEVRAFPARLPSLATYWTVLDDGLEQETLELGQQLTERTEGLDAARMANRELMAKLNRPKPSRPQPRR